MNSSLTTHLKNREWMASALAGEIHGPGRFPGWKNDLYGQSEELEPIPGMQINHEDYYLEFTDKSKRTISIEKRHVRKSTGEEILKDEPPSKRYGVALLFPRESDGEPATDVNSPECDLSEETAETNAVLPEDSSVDEQKESKMRLKRGQELAAGIRSLDEATTDESDTDALGLARIRRPRSMGITFVAEAESGPLRVDFSAARYRGMDIFVRRKDKDGEPFRKRIWVRIPAKASLHFDPADANLTRQYTVELEHEKISEFQPIKLKTDVRVRRVPESVSGFPDSARIVTVTIVNDTEAGIRAKEEEILFQSRFTVSPEKADTRVFLPLPRTSGGSDPEEQSLSLLYRTSHAFAMGHGCAGDWEAEEGTPYAAKVIAEPFPFHETPPVTPDLLYPDQHPKAGQRLSIAMLPLAKAEGEWMAPLQEMAKLYGEWIKSQEERIALLEGAYAAAAIEHVNKAKECSARIRKGLNLLQNNDQAALAFRLANEAILLQQISGRFPLREISYENQRMKWSDEISLPTLQHEKASERSWRAFQIAFLLMSIPGLWDSNDTDRGIADLIWFPTGGGKTEAYLGAAAFYLIARRLQDPDNHGTGVLMRYTLRLLTSQQFQRAAGLICALEKIRIRENNEATEAVLGELPFRIGIWVGGGTTPNSNAQSIEAYNDTRKHGPRKYQHVMLRCPWCGSEIGPKKNPVKRDQNYVLHGLRSTGTCADRRILLHCPDPDCDYHQELPVEVVDEELYKNPPSLIIGTVDKFAMLAWKHEGRSIFGIDSKGRHEVDPPGLIIQDELHLITGPLGSMVGLYEGVIEELCTRRSKLDDSVIRPKLVASTATTRASTRQIRDLYAREQVAVFPPPGLNADDSFFATYDRITEGPDKGKVKPGRMYLGILARGYGSGLTVNVRVFSALLAAASLLPEEERDPWFTLLVFYNALRELGAGLTLFGADIPERLADLRNRWTPGKERRFLNHVLELTGRLENSEIPAALKALERKYPKDRKVVDACLASNIIEVGVDVPRLAMMAVSGQPKNTAQYIQATGRVGREIPGLVAMAYDHRKARDLSHFEHFKDYHSRLYAQVEPSSVTPFTVQLLERALHGAFLAWIRNRIPVDQQNDPREFKPAASEARKSLQEFGDTMRERIRLLYRHDATTCAQTLTVFDRVLKRRTDEWDAVTTTGGKQLAVCWTNSDLSDESGDMPLLRFYGAPCRTKWLPFVWQTPSSMRGVDAECLAAIIPEP
ncbi:MAG: helicase-related protein [Opitutales bacterium]|nr:helicase-related protein [Opitutales bacterium]